MTQAARLASAACESGPQAAARTLPLASLDSEGER